VCCSASRSRAEARSPPCWFNLRKSPTDLLAEREGYLEEAQEPNPAIKAVDLKVRAGQQLQFRLRANPTFKREGKRMGHMKKKRSSRGSSVRPRPTVSGYSLPGPPEGSRAVGTVREDDKAKKITMLAVLFEGVLEVTDPERFLAAVTAGIGSGKEWGSGCFPSHPERMDDGVLWGALLLTTW